MRYAAIVMALSVMGRSAPIVSANTAFKYGAATSGRASTGDAYPTTEQPEQS